jgi:hypothetical protein
MDQIKKQLADWKREKNRHIKEADCHMGSSFGVQFNAPHNPKTRSAGDVVSIKKITLKTRLRG